MKYIPPVAAHLVTSKKGSPFAALTNILNDRQQVLALVFSCLIMMGHFLVIPFVNPFLEFNVGYSKAQTPMIYLVGGAASFASAHLLGRLADKYGKMKVFTICILSSLAIVWVITNLIAIPFFITLIIFGTWFMLSTGRMVTANAMVSNVVQTTQRGSFMSFNSSVQQLGTTLASVIAGWVVIKGADNSIQRYDWLGYLSVIILFGSLFLARHLFKKMDTQGVEVLKTKKEEQASGPEEFEAVNTELVKD